MVSYVVILAFFAFAYGAPSVNQPSGGRIIGGHEVKIEDYPHQVSLQTYGKHDCGGSLISETFIVTAAHCIYLPTSDYTVRLGSDQRSSGGIIVNVKSITVHPQYDNPRYSNDMAIVELSEPVTFSDSIQPIALPSRDEIVEDGTIVTVTGFGDTYSGSQLGSEQLLGVELVKISNEECQIDYPEETISDSTLCAAVEGGGKDSCQGDSGGPLVVNGKLFGVVAWGYDCGDAAYPGAYAFVPNLRDFINEVTGL